MNVTLVQKTEQLVALNERLRSADRVALDTEFHAERSYAARLMVVQLVVGDEVFIVDPLQLSDLRPLAQALAGCRIVGHALQSDLKIFSDDFGLLPAAAFDTQLAAAFCGYGISISLADLVHDLAGVRLRKSQTVSDWSVRPFSVQQIDYLVDDVRYLFTLEECLREKLVSNGRLSWFEEEARDLTELSHYRSDPARLYLRIPGAMRMNRRELGILCELAQLRDELARERNVPLKYIIPDDVMSGIVQLRPKVKEELAQLRRLEAGIRKVFGDRIVAAVAFGLALEENMLPLKPAHPSGVDRRDAIVSCLQVLVGAIAAEHDLPPSLLATRAVLECIARELPTSPEKIAEYLGGVHSWRAVLLAEPLSRLLCGEIGLTIADARMGAPRVERIALRCCPDHVDTSA
jgi:ribonuclease D